VEKVGYLGPMGSFTEAAAERLIPLAERVPFRSIPDTMDAVKEGIVEQAVVPLENAIEGSVNITLDYFIHHQRLMMAAEIVAPIEQHLLVAPKRQSTWESVEIIYSHPQAIAQCHQFIRRCLPHAEIAYENSTAAAAKHIKEHPEENAAAIANVVAASSYALSIAQTRINDYDNNRTRFILLKKNNNRYDNDLISSNTKYKTTMMISLASDFSGALHQVLAAFAWRKINLSKIESRPTKTGLGNYYFIIDVAMQQDTILIPGVCEELRALGCEVEVLGSYPCFTLEELNGFETKMMAEK
jgi:prephenate dehydratase